MIESRIQKQFCHCEERSDEAISARDCHTPKNQSSIRLLIKNRIKERIKV